MAQSSHTRPRTARYSSHVNAVSGGDAGGSGGGLGGGAGGGEDGPDEQTIWNENELKVVEKALASLKNTNLFKLMSMIKLMSMALHMNSHIGCVYDLNSIG